METESHQFDITNPIANDGSEKANYLNPSPNQTRSYILSIIIATKVHRNPNPVTLSPRGPNAKRKTKPEQVQIHPGLPVESIKMTKSP